MTVITAFLLLLTLGGASQLSADGEIVGRIRQSGPEAPTGTAPFNGRLATAVSQWSDHRLTSADAARVPPSLRTRFADLVRCHSAFRSRLPDSADFFTSAARPHQRALERALACLSKAQNPRSAAAEYASHARILYEWEGMHTSPLDEASYAEDYVRDHPRSPLVPYLNLFIAERIRCAFELLDGAENDREMLALADRYRVFLDRARRADPLVALIAADLDGLSFVTQNVGKHPRGFRARQ